MIRKIDESGRIVIPAEYRQALHINDQDKLEIILETNEIILKKINFGCVFCGSAIDIVRAGKLCICRSCIDRLYDAKGDIIYPISVE